MIERKPWFCQDCRVQMEYNEKKDFYKCPQCGIEVWPDSEDDTNEITSLMRDMLRTHKPKECLPAGEAAKGGGSRSKSRSRKSEMKKKSLATLNMALGFSDTRGGK